MRDHRPVLVVLIWLAIAIGMVGHECNPEPETKPLPDAVYQRNGVWIVRVDDAEYFSPDADGGWNWVDERGDPVRPQSAKSPGQLTSHGLYMRFKRHLDAQAGQKALKKAGKP